MISNHMATSIYIAAWIRVKGLSTSVFKQRSVQYTVGNELFRGWAGFSQCHFEGGYFDKIERER
jgi:hypothetical protein